MPRSFTEREKEIVRARLLQRARSCFAAYGIRKTSLDDLVKAAGISKGAFYLFFNSKEELFFEVVQEFEEDYQNSLLKEAAARPERPSGTQVARFLNRAFSLWKTHPLFAHFGPDEYQYLIRKLPEDKVALLLNRDQVFVDRLLSQWKKQGIRFKCDAKTFASLMRALFYVSLHSADLELGGSSPVQDLLIKLIVDGLVVHPQKEKLLKRRSERGGQKSYE